MREQYYLTFLRSRTRFQTNKGQKNMNSYIIEDLCLYIDQINNELPGDPIDELSVDIKCHMQNSRVKIQYVVSLRWGEVVFGNTMGEAIDELIRRTLYSQGSEQETIDLDIKIGGTD